MILTVNPSPKKSIILLSLAIFCCFYVQAQSALSISGVVQDEQGAAMNGATVFINGSTRVMPTTADGKFAFQNIAPGNYQISVQMLGHYPATENVNVIDKSVDIKILLKVKSTALREVVIGSGPNMDKYYKEFKQELLGVTENGLSCTLLNEQVVNLTAGKQFLTADADDFLVVINKRLGYRIRFQLKYFRHTLGTNFSSIAGNAVFEELWGTEAMKKEWAENRAETYRESFRHFLRTVYKGTTLKEGFIARDLYPPPTDNAYPGALYIDHRPINFDTTMVVIDSAFKSLHFKKPIYALYDPAAASEFKNQNEPLKVQPIKRAVNSTLIDMDRNRVLIDRNGTCVDCNINLNGKWGLLRLGDQVPSDYVPDK